jgi:hypothetical protein
MEFTLDELRIIQASCLTACPMYPKVEMYPPWGSIYAKATLMIERLEIAKVYGPDLVDAVLSQQDRKNQTLSDYSPTRPL